MQGSLDDPPIVIVGERWSWRRAWPITIILLAVFNQLALGGGDLHRMARSPMSWFSGAVLVLVVVSLTWQALSPPRLELSPQGIKRTVTWRTWRYGWNELDHFRLISLPRTEAVGFDYTDPAKANSGYRQWVRTSYGAAGVLAGNMEIPAAELVGLLNRARARWASAEARPVGARRPPGLIPTRLGRRSRP
jgi:hypothetical protein